MEEGEKRKPVDEEIENLTQNIINNSKDAKWAKDMTYKLIRLQKIKNEMNKEIDVSISDIQDTTDFGSFSIKKTARGYLFQCKRGFSTFVGIEMGGLCGILQTAMNYGKKEKKDEFEQYIIDCVAYVMQAPIFAALGMSLQEFGHEQDIDPLLNIGASVIKEYNRFYEKYFEDAQSEKETEEDIKDNIIFENGLNVLDNLTQDA